MSLSTGRHSRNFFMHGTHTYFPLSTQKYEYVLCVGLRFSPDAAPKSVPLDALAKHPGVH